MGPDGGVPCLVLAAGRSRRMPGRSKLDRSFGDGTVLDAVVRAARSAGLTPVVVVATTTEAPDRGTMEADRVVTLPAAGRADSLAAGLAAVPPGPVVVLLGDEPGVRPDVVERLVALGLADDLDAARVRYVDRPGHPVWLGPAGRAAALRLSGDASIWARLADADLRIGDLVAACEAPVDVDTPDALRRALARRASRPSSTGPAEG